MLIVIKMCTFRSFFLFFLITKPIFSLLLFPSLNWSTSQVGASNRVSSFRFGRCFFDTSGPGIPSSEEITETTGTVKTGSELTLFSESTSRSSFSCDNPFNLLSTLLSVTVFTESISDEERTAGRAILSKAFNLVSSLWSSPSLSWNSNCYLIGYL